MTEFQEKSQSFFFDIFLTKMVRLMGFEPTRPRTLPPEDSASAVSPQPLYNLVNQLMVGMTGFEPATP